VFHLCFDSLWAVLRLQVIPENLGGAGAYRIEWEFDDAVFKEAAYVLTVLTLFCDFGLRSPFNLVYTMGKISYSKLLIF